MFARSFATLISLASVVTFVSSNSFAGKPRYEPGAGDAPFNIKAEVLGMTGTGCPRGGAVATVAPDGGSVSILFDKMSTELAPGVNVSEQKQCMVRLGFRFSGKFRVAVVGSDVRGFVSIPEAGTSTFSVQHFSPYTMRPEHLRAMTSSQTFNGPRAEEVFIHSDFRQIAMWSQCGSQNGARIFPLMTIMISIGSVNNNPTENLLAVVDSLDLGASTLTYQLLWSADRKNCP